MHATPPTRAFDGKGAELFGGRWNEVGTPAAYASSSAALAALEYLVHTDPNDLPPDLVFAEAAFDDAALEVSSPPPGWRDIGSPAATAHGETWLSGKRALVLAVPSVVIPFETNYIINPKYVHGGSLRIANDLVEFRFDDRLLV